MAETTISEVEQAGVPGHPHVNPWAVLLVLCMGFFMILLDTTIVNIAIPSIIQGLHAGLDDILWVLNAYILVYAVLLITAGRLGDVLGQRTLFAIGLALFTVASGLCGLAQSTDQLIVARVIQGVGGALLTPQSLAILTLIFPPERRGAAFGIWGAVAGVAAVAGPTLGGLIVTHWGWRWIFYVNLPIGVAALVATFAVIPPLRVGRRHRLDLVGVVLASLGLLAIVYGLIEGERYSWGRVWGPVTIFELIAAGVVVLAVFLLWERTQAEPLVPVSLFRDRNFSLMNWIAAVMSFGMLGLFFPITIYLQSALGMSAMRAGLTVAPMSVASMIVAPFAGRMADRLGGKYILLCGLLLFSLGMALVDWLAGPDSTWLTFLGPFVVGGIGMGCVFAPSTTIAMRDIGRHAAGAASGVLNTTRQLGGVIGSAAVGALLQNRLAESLRDQAIAHAAQLPPEMRDPFIAGFSRAARGGLDVGRGAGSVPLPQGIPAQVAQQIERVAHDVFMRGFIDAMRPTLVLPIAVLIVAAASCLAIAQRRGPTEPVEAPEEAAVTA